MPSKDELSEQLNLTTKLAAQVERMAAAADKLEGSYTAQTQTLTQLAQALNQLNVQGTIQSIQALTDVLAKAKKSMDDTGKAGETNFKKLGKNVEAAGKSFKDKFPKSVAVATGAMTGLYQGIKNVVALGKGIAGFAAGFVDGLASITASIIAIPIKIFSGLIDMAAKSAGGSNELMQALEDLRKEFGAFGGPTNKAIIDTSKSLKGFEATGLSAWRVFGNMAERLKYIGELAKDMGGSFGLLRQEMEDNGGAILAYQKGLGLSGEEMKGVTNLAVSMGKKSGTVLKDMTKYSYALGESFGVDAKLISRDMGKAFADVAHFGGATVKQIAEASTYARKLGLELKDITGTLDAFDTFDTAAENVAKMSQAFGVQVDAFDLMKEQDPAKQIDMLRKAYAKAGVDAGKMDRASLKLLASTTGLDEATAKQVFSLKNQGMSMAQIQKTGSKAEKNTMTQEQAMSKLADAIERMVQSGGGMEGGFWAMFVKGIERGIMSSQEFYGLMRKIQIALRQVFMIGVQLGRALVEIVPGFKDIGKALNEMFDPKHITGLFNGVKDAVERFFGKPGGDPKDPAKGSLPDLITNLSDTFRHFFNAEGPGAKALLEGFKKMLRFMSTIVVQGVKVLSEGLAKGISYVVKMIQGKAPIPGADLAGQAASGGLGFLKEILTPIGQALKDAWKILAPQLEALASELWKQLKTFLHKHSGIILKGLAGIAALMFGPAVTRSILGVGVNMMGKAVTEVFGSVIKNAMGTAENLATKAASGGEGILSKMMGPLLGNPYVAAAAAVVALGVIGTGFSKGVEKFKDGIAKDIGDDADKKIGSSVAGLVQMLSFGAVSDDAAQGMASSFAKYSDQFNKTIEKLFGKDFAKDLKAMMSTQFDQLIDIGDFFRSLFSGDIGGAVKALGKLLWDIGLGAFNQFKFLFLTLPEKILTWLSDGVTALADWLDGLFQPGGEQSIIDTFTDGLKSVAKYVWPLVSDIPGRLMTLLGDKLLPAILRIIGSLLGLFERIPAMLFEAISNQMKTWFGKDNWASKYIFDPLKDSFYEAGNAIPFFAKYLGNALSGMTDYLKAKATGGDTSKIDIFPPIGPAFDKYKADLATTASKVADANVDVQKQIAAATAAKSPEKADPIGFVHTAAETLESVKKLKTSLAAIGEKELGEIKASFSKVLNMFGDDKELQANAAKISDVSKSFEALGSIATSVSVFQQKFTGTGDISASLDLLKGMIANVAKFMNDPSIAVTPESIAGIANVGKSFESITQVAQAYKEMSASVIKATGDIGAKGINPALMAVQKMVQAANDLNSALADGNVNKIDIKAKLENVARAVGLGGKASYTVNPSKQVQINLNLQVTMDVDKVEKVMILRQNSIIRDRIDFATSNPSSKVDNPLKGYTVESPPPIGVTGTAT